MISVPTCYRMERHGKTVADVVVLSSGRCIVAWPTSVIVYDSELAARKVHIDHMSGRGEATRWVGVQSPSPAFLRGATTAYQDRCEGIPDACGPRPPHYIHTDDRDDYEAGYWSMSREMWGTDYEPDESEWQGDRIAASENGTSPVHVSALGGEHTMCGLLFTPQLKRVQERQQATCNLCLSITEAADEAAGGAS